MSKEGQIAKQEILVEGNHDFHSVTEKIAGIVEMKNSRAWFIGFGISGFFALVLLVSIAYLLWMGTGIWGLNNPVGWGWAIVNFVFFNYLWCCNSKIFIF